MLLDVSPATETKKRADERTRTADLLIRVRQRGLQELADPSYLSGFLFCDLPCVAPYCARDDVRVVSISHRIRLTLWSSSRSIEFGSRKLCPMRLRASASLHPIQT